MNNWECVDGPCRSPLACSGFGYCRQRNFLPPTGIAMRRVILESPYAGDVEANVAYARRCIADCLRRGDSPIASHLLFTQPGILNDLKPEERALGIAAGLAWLPAAAAMVVYTDHGISPGMSKAIDAAEDAGIPVECRKLPT
jgi:hypothetical protein